VAEILRLLASSLAFLLEPQRYRIVDSSASDSFGGDASVTLQSDTTRLQLVSDRAELSMRLQPRTPAGDDWFWIGVARRVLAGDQPGSDNLDATAVAFLRTRLPEVEAAFGSDDARVALVQRLQDARAERSRELFD
jgi:hypothetical protein